MRSFSRSDPSLTAGASQDKLISVLFTEVTLIFVTVLVTEASVVTVMSEYSGVDFICKWETPFSANTWKR